MVKSRRTKSWPPSLPLRSCVLCPSTPSEPCCTSEDTRPHKRLLFLVSYFFSVALTWTWAPSLPTKPRCTASASAARCSYPCSDECPLNCPWLRSKDPEGSPLSRLGSDLHHSGLSGERSVLPISLLLSTDHDATVHTRCVRRSHGVSACAPWKTAYCIIYICCKASYCYITVYCYLRSSALVSYSTTRLASVYAAPKPSNSLSYVKGSSEARGSSTASAPSSSQPEGQ